MVGIASCTFSAFTGYHQAAGPKVGNEPAASYAYLASQGVQVIRLPIVWEAIQSSLSGPLVESEVQRLLTEISNANSANLPVIVDLHNWGRYVTTNGETLVFSRGITVDDFVDVWTKLSGVLKGVPGVYAYDLMNEPYGLTSDDSETQADAQIWEQFSQAVVTALRAAGDNTLVHIEGMNYSAVNTWASLHPTAWISDPANAVVYSAHQYFQETGDYGSGLPAPNYTYSYWSGVAAEQNGWGPDFVTWNLNNLAVFTNWLDTNGVQGDIGEVGWPSSQIMVESGVSSATATATAEANDWNALAARWFAASQQAGVSVTLWQASGLENPDGNLAFVHGAGNGETQVGNAIESLPIDTAYSQAVVPFGG
jgi:hypothetical protein